MHLLMDHCCLEKFICLGALLVDKEIAESDDYVTLSSQLRDEERPQDMKMLRALFENRINQIIAKRVPLDIIKKLRLTQAKADRKQKKEAYNARKELRVVLRKFSKPMNNASAQAAVDSKVEAETVNKSADNAVAKPSSSTTTSKASSNKNSIDDEKTMLDDAIKQLCYSDCDSVQVGKNKFWIFKTNSDQNDKLRRDGSK